MRGMMIVRLNELEMRYGAYLGKVKNKTSREQGMGDQLHAKNLTSLEADVDGHQAEIATAKSKNVYYEPTINAWDRPDVDGEQIRSTRRDRGGLIFRDRDLKYRDKKFRLVIGGGGNPEFKILGWIKGEDAMIPEYKEKLGDAWLVPQEELED
jgi:hypothetical protein